MYCLLRDVQVHIIVTSLKSWILIGQTQNNNDQLKVKILLTCIQRKVVINFEEKNPQTYYYSNSER